MSTLPTPQTATTCSTADIPTWESPSAFQGSSRLPLLGMCKAPDRPPNPCERALVSLGRFLLKACVQQRAHREGIVRFTQCSLNFDGLASVACPFGNTRYARRTTEL
jgi:hypothetical protein